MAKKGEPLPVELKEKLSRLAKERYLRNLEVQVAEPDYKRCAKCERYLLIEGNFYIRKRKTRSGVVKAPESWCIECVSEIQKARYEREKEAGTDLRARRKRYEAKEDPTRRRNRRNESEAIRRRKLGMKVRKPFTQALSSGEILPAGPLLELLQKEMPLLAQARNDSTTPSKTKWGTKSDGSGPLAEISGVPARRLYDLLHGRSERVSLSVVDRLLTGLGLPHMLPILYPED